MKKIHKEKWADPKIIHTGQHYDLNMSDVFFRDLGLPEPDINLGIGSGTHAEQTGKVMIEFEKVASQYKPDLTIVVGDVNSTMACTITAVKLNLKVAHLEAGLRSFDRTMPEEINRIVTDSLADILWTPSPDADENLLREGVAPDKIQFVGNIMIDSLEMLRSGIEQQKTYEQFSLIPGHYGVVTIHRPSNVDDPTILTKIMTALENISQDIPLIFPIHPRTRKNLENSQFAIRNSQLKMIDPLSYVPFMNLVFNCKFVITDSGGLQEETTYLGIPCFTLRPNTERPITINQGTNRLCSVDNLENNVKTVLLERNLRSTMPELWDGHTAKRVIESIKQFLMMNDRESIAGERI